MSLSDKPTQTPQSERVGEPAFRITDLRNPELLSNMIHKAGHDIGNPLTAIISLATILDRFPSQTGNSVDTEKLSSCARSIVSEAWKITQLTDRLVLLYSARPGNAVPCTLERFINRALERLKTRRGISNIKVLFSPSLSAPACVIDPEQFISLIAEILLNANQAVLENSAQNAQAKECRVYVNQSSESEWVHFTFSNDINRPCPFELQALFEPFVSEYTERKQLGIGLTTVLAIVERFSGRVHLKEHSHGDGYRFSVVISLPNAEGQ